MTGKDLLALIEASLVGDHGAPDNFLIEEGEEVPEEWRDFPMCCLAYGERDGCINERGPFGNVEQLEQEVIRQFYAVFSVLRDEALKEVGRPGDLYVHVWTEPDWEDTSHVIILDEKYGVTLCYYPCKAWQFKWDTPEEMADELETLYQQIVTNLKRAPAMAAAEDLLAALGEMCLGWPTQTPDSPYFGTYAKARAALAKAKGGIDAHTE